jgi:hypothetical protein
LHQNHNLQQGISASTRDLDWKKKYVPWFSLARRILGDLMPDVSQQDVSKWVSEQDWAMLPLDEEETAEDVKNRPYPNIWFHMEDDKMTVGLVCNTVRSIERMSNILLGFHSVDRQEFVENLGHLDDTFQTRVSTKIKEYNPRQPPDYHNGPSRQSNELSSQDFVKIFERAEEIRQQGLARRRKEGKAWSPEAPSLTLARSTFRIEPKLFMTKLAQLKPLYAISLRVKTKAQIEKAERKQPFMNMPSYRCSKCLFSTRDSKTRFCPNDGSFLVLSR